MEVRPLREEEKEIYARMVRDAFNIGGENFVAEFVQRMKVQDTRALVDDEGRVVSGLRFIWNDLWLGRQKIRFAGVTSVATPPEYRRRGLLKQLLREVLRQEYEKGINVSGLYPFEFPFYRKFGYELASSTQRITVRVAAMADFKSRVKGRWTQCTADDWERFKNLYDLYCAGKFGRLDRSEEAWWRRTIFMANDPSGQRPQTAYIWTDEEGQDRAYIIYRMVPKAGSEWDRDLKIREMVWLDEAARHEIYAFIANHDSQVERAIWSAEPGDEIYSLLSNPRAAEIEYESGYMLRLVNVEKALGERTWPVPGPGERAGFSVAVRDDVLSWNDRRTYRLAVKGETVEVSSEAGTEQAGLSCDVRVLAQLYAGYLSPVNAARLGKLEVKSEQDLEVAQRLFSPPGQPASFMNDFW